MNFVSTYTDLIPMRMNPPTSEITSVSTNQNRAVLFCTASGDCYALGNNNQKQLGVGDRVNIQHRPQKIDFNGEKIIKADISDVHSIFLTEQGQVYTCGTWGGGVTSSTTPVKVMQLQTEVIVDVVAGPCCLFARTREGNVYSWGWGQNGASGHPDANNRSAPTKINTLANVKIISASKTNSETIFVTHNNQVYYCGQNGRGQFGFASANGNNFLNRKTALELGGSIDDISISQQHLVILSDNRVYYVGNPNPGNNNHSSKLPKEIEQLRNLNVKQVQAGNRFGAALTENHLVYIWGDQVELLLGSKTSNTSLTPLCLEMDPVNNIVCANQTCVAWWYQEQPPGEPDHFENVGFETLLHDRMYCDLTIHTQRQQDREGATSECHRFVMARCPFIKQLIDKNPPKEAPRTSLEDSDNNSHISSTMTHISIDLPYSVVDIVVRFLYGESIKIDAKNLTNLGNALHAARMLEMDDLGKYALYEYSRVPLKDRPEYVDLAEYIWGNPMENKYVKMIGRREFASYQEHHNPVKPRSLLVQHLSELYPEDQDIADNPTAKLYPDITLKARDGTSFTNHRALLALCDRLARKIETGQQFNDADRVDHRPDVFHNIARHLYSGDRKIHTDNVTDLGHFNQEFRMCGLYALSAACKQKLREMAVQDEHAFEVIEVCSAYQNHDEELESISKHAQSHLSTKNSSQLVTLFPQYFMLRTRDNSSEEETDEIRRELTQLNQSHAELKESNANLHKKVDQLLDALRK
eukprot:gb/GECH01013324.1/.p1 GENE.gb/GECH01013324.1/~~gb/GECH01013324.1/.p1  ORF type:complete len:754 (+),score=115.14 gb/GECH01013324.1/:1-2262(+)